MCLLTKMHSPSHPPHPASDPLRRFHQSRLPATSSKDWFDRAELTLAQPRVLQRLISARSKTQHTNWRTRLVGRFSGASTSTAVCAVLFRHLGIPARALF